ncbi:protein RIC-3 [Rhincodon typus]|uniref:protein RIC-3 n=1 Tax=Rhincodon typus TaxID=259920 RepID=UPI00202F9492|nr:protein RIC-3 [Rhincodon typus]
MASAVHKVALLSCIVLCFSVLFSKLFVSRVARDKASPPEANLNRFSPMMQGPMVSQQKQQWSAHPHFPGSHQADSVTKAKGGNSGGGNKSFMTQIIPVYGFGLFMYVLYILFKISSKGSISSPKVRKRCRSARPGNVKRKITDYELDQLQEKLKETEVAMEKLVLKMGAESDKITRVTTEQEENLLRHLKEITRVIKKGQLFEGISPEKEAEESPYMEDWESGEKSFNTNSGPEETYQNSSESECSCPCDTNANISESNELSAEEIAEGIGTREDECSSSETMEDQIRQNKIYQALDHQPSTRIGVCSQNGGVQVEELQCEDCEYFNHESDDPAIIAENFVTSSEEASDADDQIRDESIKNISISEKQQEITCKNKGVLRKRSKVMKK